MLERTMLETKMLKKYFPVRSGLLHSQVGWIKAVDEVNVKVKERENFGLVGESGCGKSTFGKVVLGIYKPTAGEVYFSEERIDNMCGKELREVRSNIQYLYQHSAMCLDPWWKIGRSIREPLLIHERKTSKNEMNRKTREILEAVGLEASSIGRYPHEFSGGQQRRIGLVRILILNPTMIILDEPTSGLDVSVQATILKLFETLRQEYKLTYLYISHNLAVIRSVSNRIGVMYLGKIVETGEAASLWQTPLHPYTKMLFSAVPKVSSESHRASKAFIEGEPPDPQNPPSGCSFHPRCPVARDNICGQQEPPLKHVSAKRKVACHLVNTDREL